MIKEKYLGTYMKTARLFAEHSSAIRKQVGAVIVKDDRIISIGYNGMPTGWENICEYVADIHPSDPRYDSENFSKELKTRPEVIHAESNAIAKLAKSTESGDGASMFITCAPCIECAKMIYQAGIKEVFYGEKYKNDDGLNFLYKCEIKVKEINNENI